MPHTLALGPDGRVYVGEMGRIFSFDPAAANVKASIIDVVTGLPDNRLHDNRHPLSAFVFDRDGALIVNIGARSDQCLDDKGARPGPTCAEGEGNDAAAVLRRYVRDASGKWSAGYTVLASGLRNSMAFAVTPQGRLLQIENSIDIPDEDEPFDEINLIGQGKHYGWPYCMDKAKPTPGWAGSKAMDCAGARHMAPIALLDPHSAPLDMIYYSGAMFPELKGRLLVSLHGYKPSGGRIVSFAAGADGVPAGAAQDVTTGWDAKPRVRPKGSPVGMAVSPDGAIWVADDRSRAIIRFARTGS
jgi:glucose/arabinose dehydrogenase